eukprot:6173785-Pleurochrysis_carterae.AAC.1
MHAIADSARTARRRKGEADCMRLRACCGADGGNRCLEHRWWRRAPRCSQSARQRRLLQWSGGGVRHSAHSRGGADCGSSAAHGRALCGRQ